MAGLRYLVFVIVVELFIQMKTSSPSSSDFFQLTCLHQYYGHGINICIAQHGCEYFRVMNVFFDADAPPNPDEAS